MIMLQILHPLQLYQEVPVHADVLGRDGLESHHRPFVLSSGDVLLSHLPEHCILAHPGHETAPAVSPLVVAELSPVSPALLHLPHLLHVDLPGHGGDVSLFLVVLEYQQRSWQ